MVDLANVRDWLKTFGVGQFFYIGKLDAKKSKSVGVYQRKPIGRPRVALGGIDCTGYDVKSISVLIHWNQNARETEQAACKLFDRLRAAQNVVIGGVPIYILSLEVPEPVDVGTDDGGVYERVIWFDLYYERK